MRPLSRSGYCPVRAPPLNPERRRLAGKRENYFGELFNCYGDCLLASDNVLGRRQLAFVKQ